MKVYQWAIKWGIPLEAVKELQAIFGAELEPVSAKGEGKSEAFVQSKQLLRAAQQGAVLWRNNSGVLEDRNGRPVRYGLCNESKKQNEKMKSSDLVGIKPVIITPEMVGLIFGQFYARECKPEDWRFTGTAREVAQLNFNQLVCSLGGDAAFTNGSDL